MIDEQTKVNRSGSFLRRVRSSYERYRDAEAKYDELCQDVGVKGTDYSAVRVSSSPTPDGVHDIVMRRKQARDRLGAAKDEFTDAYEQATEAIMSLDDADEASVLYRRFILMEEPRYAMRELHMCRSRFYEVQRSGLANLYEHIPLSDR